MMRDAPLTTPQKDGSSDFDLGSATGRRSPGLPHSALPAPIRAVCFDWGGTLMVDDGPDDLPMYEWPSVTAVPGARECLAALHGRVPLCIATNGFKVKSFTKMREFLGFPDHHQVFSAATLGYRAVKLHSTSDRRTAVRFIGGTRA